MVKSYLSLFIRNRKVHFLVFLVTVLTVVFHTLRGQGITIKYTSDDPHSSELTYETISENIKNGYVVTDIRVQRCLRGFDCSAPKAAELSFWVKIPSKLNLYPLSTHFFNYYMYIEKMRINEANRYILGIEFTPSDKPPQEGYKRTQKISSNSYIWIKYLKDMDYAARVVRDVNILYGKHDMIDFREHWKFSPEPIQLPLKQLIQPKLSLLTIAVNDEMEIFNKDQEFDAILKKNEIIITADPSFKVLQISDMHIGQDSGKCDGTMCKFDMKTLTFIDDVIGHEADAAFVIFTGDMIDFTRVKHFESAVLKALAPVLKNHIPFVFTFGDSEHEWSNRQSKINILNFVASLPLCYNKRPSQLDHRMHGLTNGNLKVYRVPPAGSLDEFDYNKLNLVEPSALLTYLDSEEMYLDETQSNYLYRLKSQMPKVDLKLLFFHNPIPNFRPRGKFLMIGNYNEKHRILTKTSKDFLEDARKCDYRAVSIGHEHENDGCIWDEADGVKVLLCYSGATGESAVTKLDENFTRRLRVFDISFDRNEIFSWKRMKGAKSSEVSDPQLIWKGESDKPAFAESLDSDHTNKDKKPVGEVAANKPVDKPLEKGKPEEEATDKTDKQPEEPSSEKQPAGKEAADKESGKEPADKEVEEKPDGEGKTPSDKKPAAGKVADEEEEEEDKAVNDKANKEKGGDKQVDDPAEKEPAADKVTDKKKPQ